MERQRIPLPTPNPNPGDTSMMMITRASKATSTVVRAAPRVVFVIFVVTVASLFTIRTTASPLAAGCEPGRPSPRPPAEHPGVPCRRLSETLSGRRGLRQALNNPECSFDSGDCDGIPWDTDSSNIASCCLQVCTGEDACEGRGHDEETCLSVGCCRWDPQPEGDCWSLVGTEKCDPEPDQMCYHAQLCSNNYHCGGPTHIWIYYTFIGGVVLFITAGAFFVCGGLRGRLIGNANGGRRCSRRWWRRLEAPGPPGESYRLVAQITVFYMAVAFEGGWSSL